MDPGDKEEAFSDIGHHRYASYDPKSHTLASINLLDNTCCFSPACSVPQVLDSAPHPEGESHFSVLAALHYHVLSLKVTTRLEPRGTWLVSPLDLTTYEWVNTNASGLVEINARPR